MIQIVSTVMLVLSTNLTKNKDKIINIILK